MKKFLCLLMALAMSCSLFACKSKATASAEEQINALGTITLESGDAIAAARAAVDALKTKDRVKVENVDVLAAAETVYQNLLYTKQADDLEELIHGLRPITLNSGEALNEADRLYNEADINVKVQVENFSELVTAFQLFRFLRIDQVEVKINAILDVTEDSGPAIETAQKAYDELNAEDQTWVYNAYMLKEAQKEFKALQNAPAAEEEK